ncbi:hypothetical protein Q9L58_003265 [Maublancomyces gigas]|uniref:Ribosomal protein S13 n=1 Tax=Discina gigas TaxID=1032678 RepID=A0ABR3GPH5_9PEZI
MVLISGINILDQWVVKAALQYHFYGIGPNVAARLCAKLSIHPTARLSSLSHPTVTALTFEMSKLKLDTDLKKELTDNLERLRDLGTYRGRRHAQGLPVRGQKTKKQVMCARRLNCLNRRG